MNNDVIFDVENSIATITLNRTAKHNALTIDMLTDLEASIAVVKRDVSVKVVAIRSSSERFFSSGADIKE